MPLIYLKKHTLMTSQSRSMHSSSSSSSLPEGYKADPNQGPMLRYQASLPHLPVPPLASTLAKYLETIRPHLTPAEYTRSESTVRAFGASAHAVELQRRLEERAAGTVNWLADWWNETAYMAYRDPVVVNVSYFYVHLADPAIGDAPRRAATLLKAMLRFRALVETCVCTESFPVAPIWHANVVTIVVLVLSWNLRRSAARRFAWTRTSGCKCIYAFAMFGDVMLSCSGSTPVDIPPYQRIPPTNLIPQHTITSFSFVTTDFSRSNSRTLMRLS